LAEDELLDLLKGKPGRIMQSIEKELHRQKEEELRALPIDRIRYFERILRILGYVSTVGDHCSLDSDRRLSSHKLLRFTGDRFGSLSRLLSDVMKPEQLVLIDPSPCPFSSKRSPRRSIVVNLIASGCRNLG
jgi:hypothetical protein